MSKARASNLNELIFLNFYIVDPKVGSVVLTAFNLDITTDNLYFHRKSNFEF
jgi:hypothetical protein